MTEIEDQIIYKLGSIETNLTEVKTVLSGIPCSEHLERIARIEQTAQNNIVNKNDKFKLNAQILSIIAIIISTLVAISSLYANFIK